MADPGRPRVTIRDVALQAGVSFKSVSNVINGNPFVSEQLRSKVQSVIDELGYRPHSAARSLASSRSNLIGVVLRASSTDAHTDPFLSQFLLGVCAAAGAEGFGILVSILPNDEPIRRYADIFDHRQVDGLIVFCPRIDDASGVDEDVPSVRIGRASPATDALAVDGDNEQGAHAAVSHLIALGHRHIGMVANADFSFSVARTRVDGYIRALHEHDLRFDESLLVLGRFSTQSGREAMEHLLSLPGPPSAVFVSSDRMALGAIQAARDHALRVPDDLALVGYDDLFMAEHTCPPLTTIRTPIDAISTRSTSMLIDAIRGIPIEARQVILPTELVVRYSCGARGLLTALR